MTAVHHRGRTAFVSLSGRVERLFDISRDGKPTLPAMSGLRGVAVLLVFLTHYVTLIAPWLDPRGLTFRIASAMELLGDAGVDLFFVISGYLIYGTLIRNAPPLSRFLKRRVQRIYPTFLCVLGVYVCLAFVFPDERKMPAGWTAIATYIAQNALLLPGVFKITPIITVAWSLSYEALYYLTVPVVIGALGLRSRDYGRRLILVTLFTLSMFVTLEWSAPGHIRLVMFTAGMLLFDMLDGHVWRSRYPFGLAALGAAIALMLVSGPNTAVDTVWRCITLYVCFFVLCMDAFGWQTATGRVLSFAPLRWLGNMSYSYYLIHGLTVKAAVVVLRWISVPHGDGQLMFWLALVPMLALTLASATVLFVFVEKPLSFPGSLNWYDAQRASLPGGTTARHGVGEYSWQ